jgi:hypothetical protein
MTRTTDALDRLRAADPLAGRAIVAPAENAARRPRRAVRVAVATVAVVAVGAGAFLLLPGGAVTATDARAVGSLLDAGRAAAAAVDAPLGRGQVVYSRTESAYLSQVTGPDGSQLTYIAAPRVSESWIAHDGALTRLEVVDGQPWYPSAKVRAQVLAVQRGAKAGAGGGAGAKDDPGVVGVPGVSDRAVVRIPAYRGTVNAPTYDSCRTLPTDPAALEQLIRHDTAGSGESADVEVWVTVRDLLLAPVCPAGVRSALYQVAASVPGVRYLGEETDRSGRHGVAVGLSHGDDSHARSTEVMVFDPRTGLLLQSEERADDPSQWGLPAADKGAVVGWTLWVSSAVVDGVGVRPDGSHADL